MWKTHKYPCTTIKNGNFSVWEALGRLRIHCVEIHRRKSSAGDPQKSDCGFVEKS